MFHNMATVGHTVDRRGRHFGLASPKTVANSLVLRFVGMTTLGACIKLAQQVVESAQPEAINGS